MSLRATQWGSCCLPRRQPQPSATSRRPAGGQACGPGMAGPLEEIIGRGASAGIIASLSRDASCSGGQRGGRAGGQGAVRAHDCGEGRFIPQGARRLCALRASGCGSGCASPRLRPLPSQRGGRPGLQQARTRKVRSSHCPRPSGRGRNRPHRRRRGRPLSPPSSSGGVGRHARRPCPPPTRSRGCMCGPWCKAMRHPRTSALPPCSVDSSRSTSGLGRGSWRRTESGCTRKSRGRTGAPVSERGLLGGDCAALMPRPPCGRRRECRRGHLQNPGHPGAALIRGSSLGLARRKRRPPP